MSFESNISRVDYVGNGSATAFSYPFKIFSASDLQVTVKPIVSSEATLTLGVDYTVTGVASPYGGSITISAGAPLNGTKLSIRRVRPINQKTDLRNQGDYLPEIVEDSFDQAAMVSQQLKEELDRSIRLSPSVAPASFSAVLPATIVGDANRTITTNALGNGFILGPTADSVSGANQSAINAAASAAAAVISAAAAAATAAGLVPVTDALNARLNTIEIGGPNKINFSVYSYTSFSDPTTAKSIDLFLLPAGEMLEHIYIRPITAFTGGTFEVAIGEVGDPEMISSYYDLAQTPAGRTFKAANFMSVIDFDSATQIKLFGRSLTALSSLTLGSFSVYVLTRKIA